MHVSELDSIDTHEIDALEAATSAHHRAFQAAYDDILPRSVIDRVSVIDRWSEAVSSPLTAGVNGPARRPPSFCR